MAETFRQVITAAVNDFAAHGYDNPQRLEMWLKRIREAAERDLTPPSELAEALKRSLGQVYDRLVTRDGVLRTNPGATRYTLDKVRPALRADLDRRLMASADLIRRNRAEAVEKTLHRFSGWATSIPVGGSDAVERVETKAAIRKSLAQLPFAERRVIIDQGHKLAASINETVARGGGALAAVWHSRWRQPGYNYRVDHKERDEHVYALRDNWALEAGLMKAGPDGYLDDITKPGEEPFCRCSAVYLYNLRDLPDAMVTRKGREELERVRGLLHAAQ